MRQSKHTHAYEQKSSIPHAYEPKSSILMIMNQNKAYPTHMKKKIWHTQAYETKSSIPHANETKSSTTHAYETY